MRTPRPRTVLAAAGFAAATALAGCASDPQIADITTIAPPPTTAPTAAPATAAAPANDDTAPASSAPATSAPDTSVSANTDDTASTADPAASNPDPTGTLVPGPTTGPMFSDDLGERVTSAPGVRTPGDTRRLLPDGLYIHLAWTADPTDPSVFTPTPDDIPILEAYANAITVFYRAAMTTVTTDDPAFTAFFVDGGAKYEAAFAQARDGGFRKELGDGVLLRPYVLADNRDDGAAIVLDCVVSNERWVSDGAASESGSAPDQLGVAATVIRVDGKWIVDTVSEASTACL